MAVTELQRYKSQKVNNCLTLEFEIMKNLNSFKAFELGKAQMNAIAGGAPPVYEYSCKCRGTDSRPFKYYIEKSEQLMEADSLCDYGVDCHYVGIEM